jgi:hypothetical protein
MVEDHAATAQKARDELIRHRRLAATLLSGACPLECFDLLCATADRPLNDRVHLPLGWHP